jgi:nicotinate-nucleotide--dimethylbenzimidazole phosphoribosyltransferase
MMFDVAELERRIRARLDRLTKPPGSLGLLEELVVRFALIKGEEMPSAARKTIYVFCADHGVAAEGVSPYPPEVTQQMMRNFVAGGAAISVLARGLEAETTVVDAGACGPPVTGVVDRKIAHGTSNCLREPAMTRSQAQAAIAIGEEMASAAAAGRYDLVGLGEMGIGNTTAAAAIVSAITGRSPEETVGPGTGLSAEGVKHKIDVVRRSIDFHKPDPNDGIAVLASVGGFEIGAIAGFLLRASELRLPVVLDGFPCGCAALIARTIKTDALKTAFASHRSSECGHDVLLQALDMQPYFDFGMRLGEGTGAALMMSLIDISIRLYREMATFDEAGVSGITSRLQ